MAKNQRDYKSWKHKVIENNLIRDKRLQIKELGNSYVIEIEGREERTNRGEQILKSVIQRTPPNVKQYLILHIEWLNEALNRTIL